MPVESSTAAVVNLVDGLHDAIDAVLDVE